MLVGVCVSSGLCGSVFVVGLLVGRCLGIVFWHVLLGFLLLAGRGCLCCFWWCLSVGLAGVCFVCWFRFVGLCSGCSRLCFVLPVCWWKLLLSMLFVFVLLSSFGLLACLGFRLYRSSW